jgi:Flp pilus assembly protein TadD
MRSATLTNGTILGLLATGALMTACAHDASHDGDGATLLAANATAVPASLDVSSAPPPAEALPETSLGPVDPAVARAAWKEGVANFNDGDYAAAVTQLRLAVAGEPDDAYRRYLLGLALWKSNDPAGAEASFVESLKLDATRLKTWINLARVRNEQNDRAGALEASDKALDLEPTSAEALHQKGRALSELGRRDDALEALETARDLDPDSGYIANTLGLVLIQTGRPADAIEPLEVAKLRLPHVAYVRNNLGVAYERTGRLDEAKVEYLAAVEAGDMGGKAMKSLVRLGATDTTNPSVTAVAATAVPPADAK